MADTTVSGNVSGALGETGLGGPYWIDTLKAVVVYVSSTDNLRYAITDDGGATWTDNKTIVNGGVEQFACWFDRETPGDTGTLVHVVWVDNTGSAGSEDCHYNYVDIDADSIGTERTVDGSITVSTTSQNNRLGITKTVSGNIITAFSTQTEIQCNRSTDLFVSSNDVRSDVFETAIEEDQILLFPANTGDNDDACAIFWDRSADEISVKMYDESGNSWTETSISGSMVASTFRAGNMDASVRHSDNHILLAAHSGEDTAGDDIKTWDLTVDSISTPTVTAKADMVSSQAESGLIGMVINQQTDDVYVAYAKGGTYLSSTDVVFYKSTDGMANWDVTESSYSEDTADDIRHLHAGRTIGDDGGRIQYCWYNDDLTEIFINLNNDIEVSADTGGGTLTISVQDCMQQQECLI